VQYHCDAKYHPGDKCRKAEDVCDKPAYFDEHCYCPPNGFKPKTKVKHLKDIEQTALRASGLCYDLLCMAELHFQRRMAAPIDRPRGQR
jgi:hypothetical protein